jgi:hypothetical protein
MTTVLSLGNGRTDTDGVQMTGWLILLLTIKELVMTPKPK